MLPSFIGVLNCTPDSFSDGGTYFALSNAIQHALTLQQQGAAVLDVGGDASGPGSRCVGAEEEWRRIAPLLAKMSESIPISVDTHQPLVAKQALSLGVSMINDINSAQSRALLEVVAEADAQYIGMYSRCPKPHNFAYEPPCAIVKEVQDGLESIIERALDAGIAKEKVWLDPGMGAFLSKNAEDSLAVLNSVPTLLPLGYPLVLGISRKRFLRKISAEDDIDTCSAQIAFQTWQRCDYSDQLHFRVHAVEKHIDYFTAALEAVC